MAIEVKRTVIVVGGARCGKSAAVAEALRKLEEDGARIVVVEPLDIPGASEARRMAELGDRIMAEVRAAYAVSERLVRDTSTPEKRAWWDAVLAAAADAPTLLYERPEEEED